ASYGWNDVVPFDGVGYHIYVAQGSDETTSSVASKVTTNLSAIWNVVAANGDGSKRLWVSEMGWRTGLVSAAQQRDFMTAGIGALDAFGKVELGVYFSLQDFGDDNQWGIFTGPPYDTAHQKTSYGGFADAATLRRPAYAAFPTLITVP